MKLSSLATFLLLLSILYSCSPGSSSSGSQGGADEEKTVHDIDKLLEDMPPPSLVPFTLKSIGATFDLEHVSAASGAEKYQGNTDKMALNMGVYASDISYLAAYGKEEECLNYLSVAHDMAESLGESAIYDQTHLDEFRGHVADENEEEVSRMLSKLFMETSVQMEEDHHLTMAGLALTGSYIEGLYQAVITLEKYDNSEDSQKLLEPLVKIVLDEEEALLDIIQVLNDLPFDDTIGSLLTQLRILDRLYKGDLQEVVDKMENNPDYIVSKEVMRDITLEVKEIRASIVE